MKKKYLRDKNYNILSVGDIIEYRGHYKDLEAKIIYMRGKSITVKHINGTTATIWAEDSIIKKTKIAHYFRHVCKQNNIIDNIIFKEKIEEFQSISKEILWKD